MRDYLIDNHEIRTLLRDDIRKNFQIGEIKLLK